MVILNYFLREINNKIIPDMKNIVVIHTRK